MMRRGLRFFTVREFQFRYGKLAERVFFSDGVTQDKGEVIARSPFARRNTVSAVPDYCLQGIRDKLFCLNPTTQHATVFALGDPLGCMIRR